VMAFIISSKKPLRTTTRTFFSAPREDEDLVRIGVVAGGIIIVLLLGEGTLAEREEVVVVVVVISFPASLIKME